MNPPNSSDLLTSASQDVTMISFVFLVLIDMWPLIKHWMP